MNLNERGLSATQLNELYLYKNDLIKKCIDETRNKLEVICVNEAYLHTALAKLEECTALAMLTGPSDILIEEYLAEISRNS